MSKKRLVISVILLVCVALMSLYVVQSMGVCLKEGRVLSPEELRERVLQSFVKLRIQYAIDADGFNGSGRYGVGIVNSASGVEIEKILEKLYSSEKSIVESLELEPPVVGDLSKREYGRGDLYFAKQTNEPFVLLSYARESSYITSTEKKIGKTEGRIWLSSDIQKVDYDRIEKKLLVKQGFIKSFINGLCGYNNHYYQMKFYYFRLDCDSSVFANEDLQKECKEIRRQYFEQSIERQSDYIFSNHGIIAISNCGDILTQPHDNGMPERDIQWVGSLKR